MSQTKSIIDELNSFIRTRDKHSVIESRAQHVIASAINLMEAIRENFTSKEFEELQRKLLIAIKKEDPKKFTSKIRALREGIKGDNNE